MTLTNNKYSYEWIYLSRISQIFRHHCLFVSHKLATLKGFLKSENVRLPAARNMVKLSTVSQIQTFKSGEYFTFQTTFRPLARSILSLQLCNSGRKYSSIFVLLHTFTIKSPHIKILLTKAKFPHLCPSNFPILPSYPQSPQQAL